MAGGLKVVFILRSLGVGGAESQLRLLAGHLQRRGERVSIVTLYPVDDVCEDLDECGVEVISLGKRSRWDLFLPFLRLLQQVRRISPDIIHGYLPSGNLLALIAARAFLRSRPVVFGVRSGKVDLRQFDGLTRVSYASERYLARHASAVIANSEEGASRYTSTPGRAVVIPNGINVDKYKIDVHSRDDLRAEWGLTSGVMAIGMVARVDPTKDHLSFLKAAKVMLGQGIDARFLCIGGGDMRRQDALNAQANALGLQRHIMWCGERSDIERCYNALDIVVLASHGEGFPNVVAEAMACGTPVVATDVGSVAGILGDTGVLVRPNQPAEIAEGCQNLIRQIEDNGPRLRRRCRSRIVEMFSVEALVENTRAVLAEVVLRAGK